MSMNSRAIAQRSIARQDTAPEDTSLLWLDTTFDPAKLKQYNGSTSEWQSIASSVVTKQDTAPEAPEDGDIWQDTSVSPAILKRYESNTSEWIRHGPQDAYKAVREREYAEFGVSLTDVEHESGDKTGPGLNPSNYPATYTHGQIVSYVEAIFNNDTSTVTETVDIDLIFEDSSENVSDSQSVGPGERMTLTATPQEPTVLREVVLDARNLDGGQRFNVNADRPPRGVLKVVL